MGQQAPRASHDALAISGEVTINAQGGLQSKIEGAFHAIPPRLLRQLSRFHLEKPENYHDHWTLRALKQLGHVLDDKPDYLGFAIEDLFLAIAEETTGKSFQGVAVGSPLARQVYGYGLMRIATVRAAGIKKYHFNNPRLISYREHLDHMGRHILLLMQGDTSEDHLGNAATRGAFAMEVFETDPEARRPFKELPPLTTGVLHQSFGQLRQKTRLHAT